MLPFPNAAVNEEDSVAWTVSKGSANIGRLTTLVNMMMTMAWSSTRGIRGGPATVPREVLVAIVKAAAVRDVIHTGADIATDHTVGVRHAGIHTGTRTAAGTTTVTDDGMIATRNGIGSDDVIEGVDRKKNRFYHNSLLNCTHLRPSA